MFSLIVLLPFLGAVFTGFLGYRIGHQGSKIVTIGCIFVSFILSCFVFFNVFYQNTITYIHLLNWFNFGLIQANWAFIFDGISVSMLFVVTFISLLVHIYSTDYMGNDPHLSRFMTYLSLFTFFMLILVTADNFIQLFFGWEGVGLCSYLLIGFWYTRISANKAALKAIIINRIGDFGILLGICFIYIITSAIDYSSIFLIIPYLYKFGNLYILGFITFICFFLFVGAMGKSAQIGLHTWLPDAMEGPTPVSALIHAATMVTAGVFLIIRCSLIFEYASSILLLLLLIGGFTSIFAAMVGLVQNDLKKVIAYSTCSQLGYMIFACGLSAYHISFFHLINHAFFKALLFLSAGSVIHALHDEQDMRKMGGLIKYLPLTYTMMLIGSFSLMGLPFLTGFYSKEFILEMAYTQYNNITLYVYWLGLLAALCTAFYSCRLLLLVFIVNTNIYKPVLKTIHEGSWILLMPLIVLSFFSIFFGYLMRELFVSIGADFFGFSLYIKPMNFLSLDYEFLPLFIKLMPLILSLFGSFLAYTLYATSINILYTLNYNIFFNKIYRFLSKKWHFDLLHNNLIAFPFLKSCYTFCFLILDKGFIEIFGPYGITKTIYKFSIKIQKLNNGFLNVYLSFIFIIFLLFWNFLFY